MALKLLFVAILQLSIFKISAEVIKFDNYTLYKVYPKSDKHIEILRLLKNAENDMDFWTDPEEKTDFVNIMTRPSYKETLESFLKDSKIEFDISIPDVQTAINNQKQGSYHRSISKNMEWNAYYDLDSIYNWLDDLVADYSNYASEIKGGETYEGRKIKGIKISHGSGKRAVFLEGGIHSREWISPATVCYIAHQLLTSDDPEIKSIAEGFDWYIFPVTNPDGYVYTFTTNRMWRKNRTPLPSGNYGVDLNRNWNSHWLVAGASTNPEADDYAGSGPFSEIETRTLSAYIQSISDKIDMYLSFHSYSQYLLLPYGNSTGHYGNYYDAIFASWEEWKKKSMHPNWLGWPVGIDGTSPNSQVNIGRRAMGALSVRYGTSYVTGNVAEVIYLATGGSIDWVKDVLNIPLVYCYELRDRGQFGFLLPTDQILPNNEETMDSVVDLIHQAKRFGYMNSGIVVKISYACFVLVVVNMIFW